LKAPELRAYAERLRQQSVWAASRHVLLARHMMITTGPPGEALQIEAQVADCMARRFRQWADQIDVAASELEDP
jgi:hypothetical protein